MGSVRVVQAAVLVLGHDPGLLRCVARPLLSALPPCFFWSFKERAAHSGATCPGLLFVSSVLPLALLGELVGALGVAAGFSGYNPLLVAFTGLATLQLVAVCLLSFLVSPACSGNPPGSTVSGTTCTGISLTASIGSAVFLAFGAAFGALGLLAKQRGKIMVAQHIKANLNEVARVRGLKEMKVSLKATFRGWGQELAQIFKDFDEDGDGIINEIELFNGLKCLGAVVGRKEVHDLFHQIDADGSGEIGPWPASTARPPARPTASTSPRCVLKWYKPPLLTGLKTPRGPQTMPNSRTGLATPRGR